MSQTIDVNGQSINYPEIGDTNWGDEATDFAIQTSAALGKLGLASGTSVDIAQTLDVTGNTTLDANLSVGGDASVTGNTTLTGNITVNGNSNLGNGTSDTTAITGILNVDSGVLYVDPTNNRVGINDTTPSVELDVNGAVAITGNETVGGTLNVTGATTLSSTLGVTGDVAVNTNKFNVTASSGNTTIAGTLGISNGTASAPSLTPSGDTNTGLYSIGSDIIGFAANGLRIGEFGSGYGGFTGNVIQVVSTTKTNTATISSGNPIAFADITGLSVNITPKYSNSKMLIMAMICYGADSASAIRGFFRFMRDSTAIGIGDPASNRTRSSFVIEPFWSSYSITMGGMNFLDTVSSLNQITYKIQICLSGINSTAYINRDFNYNNTDAFSTGTSSITVMEIQQ